MEVCEVIVGCEDRHGENRKGHRFLEIDVQLHRPLCPDNNDSPPHLCAEACLLPVNLEALLRCDKPFVTRAACGKMADAHFSIVFSTILVGQRALREFAPEGKNQMLLFFEVVSRETGVGGTLGRRFCSFCL